jgi:hypothetical protein
MKRIAMVLVCVMVLSALAIGGVANATVANPGWYNVTLVSIGSLPSYGLYVITCSSDDTTWTGNRVFLMDATNQAMKTSLAAALTGYSVSGKASIYLPTTQAANTFFDGVYAGTLD